MGCKNLDITAYYRIINPEPDTLSDDFFCAPEKPPRGFNPVVSVSIPNYRYYSPELGRWLSRDPIEEQGGINLYVMVMNKVVNIWDYLGNNEANSANTGSSPKNKYLSYDDYPKNLDGNCGEFRWFIKWHLPHPTDGGGYVVQRIKVAFDITDCDGNVKERRAVMFWEAWKVPAGGVLSIGGDNWEVFDRGCCTKGDISVNGVARFHEGYTLPAHFVSPPPKGVPAGKKGPATLTDPKIKGGTAPLSRSMTISWNCCEEGGEACPQNGPKPGENLRHKTESSGY